MSLSYGNSLYGRHEIIDIKAEHSKHFLKKFSTFLKDKAEIERNYIKAYRKCIEKWEEKDRMTTYETSSMLSSSANYTVDHFFLTFLNYQRNLCGELEEVASKNEDELVFRVLSLREWHSKLIKKQDEEVKAILKKTEKVTEELDKAEKNTKKYCAELMQVKERHKDALAQLTTSNSSGMTANLSPESDPPVTNASPSSSFEGSTTLQQKAEAVTTPSPVDKKDDKVSMKSLFSKFGIDSMKNRLKLSKVDRLASEDRIELQSNNVHANTNETPVNISPVVSNSAIVPEKVIEKYEKETENLLQTIHTWDERYISAIKNFRELKPSLDSSYIASLNEYQRIEEKKDETLSEMMRDYCAFQTQFYRNQVTEIEGLSAMAGKMDAQTQSETFIKMNASRKRPATLPIYQLFPGHPHFVSEKSEAEIQQEGIVRKNTHDEAEEKNYARLMAEQIFTLYLGKVTGRGNDKVSSVPTNDSSPDATSQANESRNSVKINVEQLPSQPLDLEETTIAKRLLLTAEGRVAFATTLNLQRNYGYLHLSTAAYTNLSTFIMLFLDAALEAMHVTPAQLVMIMSQSLYKTNPSDAQSDTNNLSSPTSDRSSRVYLSASILDHPIWQNLRFWELSFFDALESKMSSVGEGGGEVTIQRWHSDTEQRQSLHARTQAAFGTLSTFAMNMNEFGMNDDKICKFVEKMGLIHDLPSEQMEMLRTMSCFHSQVHNSPDIGETTESPADDASKNVEQSKEISPSESASSNETELPEPSRTTSNESSDLPSETSSSDLHLDPATDAIPTTTTAPETETEPIIETTSEPAPEP